MGVAWEHVDALDVVARNLKLDDLVRTELAFLDETVTAHHNEELPLGVVPVLAFGDAGLADVDAHLATVQGVNQFSEATTVIHVHLQRESDFLLREIA